MTIFTIFMVVFVREKEGAMKYHLFTYILSKVVTRANILVVYQGRVILKGITRPFT